MEALGTCYQAAFRNEQTPVLARRADENQPPEQSDPPLQGTGWGAPQGASHEGRGPRPEPGHQELGAASASCPHPSPGPKQLGRRPRPPALSTRAPPRTASLRRGLCWGAWRPGAGRGLALCTARPLLDQYLPCFLQGAPLLWVPGGGVGVFSTTDRPATVGLRNPPARQPPWQSTPSTGHSSLGTHFLLRRAVFIKGKQTTIYDRTCFWVCEDSRPFRHLGLARK